MRTSQAEGHGSPDGLYFSILLCNNAMVELNIRVAELDEGQCKQGMRNELCFSLVSRVYLVFSAKSLEIHTYKIITMDMLRLHSETLKDSHAFICYGT